jgi:hypothetical protein
MDYPSFVGIVAYFGLDPITVWYEYRTIFLVLLALLALSAVYSVYWLVRWLILFAAEYRYSFADKMPFYRAQQQLPAPLRERVSEALGGESFVYAMPAIAGSDVPKYKQKVGFLLLSPTRLIFLPRDGAERQGVSFPLSSFPDANIKDSKKSIELKLIQKDAKPTFQLLGVSRDHAQELFMKMHSFRQELGPGTQAS